MWWCLNPNSWFIICSTSNSTNLSKISTLLATWNSHGPTVVYNGRKISGRCVYITIMMHYNLMSCRLTVSKSTRPTMLVTQSIDNLMQLLIDIIIMTILFFALDLVASAQLAGLRNIAEKRWRDGGATSWSHQNWQRFCNHFVLVEDDLSRWWNLIIKWVVASINFRRFPQVSRWHLSLLLQSWKPLQPGEQLNLRLGISRTL